MASQLTIRLDETPTPQALAAVQAFIAENEKPKPLASHLLTLTGVDDDIATYRTGDYRVVEGQVQSPMPDGEAPACVVQWKLPRGVANPPLRIVAVITESAS